MTGSFSVPDAVSPVTGWRYWYVDRGALRSLTAFAYTRWPPGTALRARCRALLPHALGPPDGECTCGIYAARDLATLKALTHPGVDGPVAVGEVALWGRVIEAERGYRAEQAYPRRLWVIRESVPEGAAGELAARLAAAYGVPVMECDAAWALPDDRDTAWGSIHPRGRFTAPLAGAAVRTAVLAVLGVLGAVLAPDPLRYLGAWAAGSLFVLASVSLGLAVAYGKLTPRQFVAVHLAMPLAFAAVVLAVVGAS